MFKLTIDNNNYNCLPDESVLHALLRQNIDISHSCQKGTCHSCLLQSQDLPPQNSQKGLKNTSKLQNNFLACLCIPKQDMVLKLPDQSSSFTEVKVISNKFLNQNTCLLVLERNPSSKYKAGQFVNIKRADGLTRSYSIASASSVTHHLEFHIRRLPEGKFSQWVHDKLKKGDTLQISEPKGDCFYISEDIKQNLLLIGTGTGLAPLLGITLDAIAHNHLGQIYLYHGSSQLDDLYKIDELKLLAEKHQNFHYTPCISSNKVQKDFKQGRANEIALTMHPNLSNWKVFLCGHPEMVTQMKMDAFLKGAAISNIYSDAFYSAKNSKNNTL